MLAPIKPFIYLLTSIEKIFLFVPDINRFDLNELDWAYKLTAKKH